MAQITTNPVSLVPTVRGSLRFDALAGFFVFLIALPLCLAIAKASSYPPIAGIWAAVIGGVFTSLLSNAELTIKGPAAGLIVIVAGCVSELGREFATPGMSETERAYLGYTLSLGIGVAAGLIQIIFGLLRAGRLADFFPLTPVHGMLASIGLIIISKQIYEVLGVAVPKHPDGSSFSPPELYANLPSAFRQMNPEVAIIGFVSLAILFVVPLLAKWLPILKKLPSQLIVLVIAIGLGSVYCFDLQHEHTYLFPDHIVDGHLENGEYSIGPKFLVSIPAVLEKPSEAFAAPDFRGLMTFVGLKYLVLFTLIGSLESLLSAKAVELIDPWKRKSNFDRDLFAVGLANTIAAMVGGLPMISEIVRSRANIDSGARTRTANAFHGLFLLGFVLFLPTLIQGIPLAALGAMLIYTGFRLANPSEFARTWTIGREQFLVFLGTIVATLATDLLIGMAAGVGIKMLFHLWNGASLRGFLAADFTTVSEDGKVTIIVRKAALFSNWLALRRAILEASRECDAIVADLRLTKLVDHSVMDKLHELETELTSQGKQLTVVMSETHIPLGQHALSAQRNKQPQSEPIYRAG